jgi:hypothetical protein
MRHWVNDCCGQRIQDCPGTNVLHGTTLPKRLIKIGSSTEPLRLVTPNQGAAYQYALLSYCWGGGQAGKTLKSNLPLYETSIPSQSLSASVRSAIAVTRAMEVKYLWVDLLCTSPSFFAYQSKG